MPHFRNVLFTSRAHENWHCRNGRACATAPTMETGLFEIQVEHLRDYRQNRQLLPQSHDIVHGGFLRADSFSAYAASDTLSNIETAARSAMKADATGLEFARCFLRLANLPNFALDRLSRYEATLWRQVGRILVALNALDRRKPQERRRHFRIDSPYQVADFERQ